ncbi:MAG TPA: hypothetical protein VIF14_01975 [Alphaproteobacteria bacterium]|jgi:hypothetical protein
MTFPIRRAGSVALAFAAALAMSTAFVPARAEDGRVITVQSDLQKRADALLQGIGEGGGKVKYGAVEPGATKDGLVIKDVEITSPDSKTVKIERIEVRDFDWERPKEPQRMDLSVKRLVIPAEALEKDVADLGLTSLTINADFAYALDEAKKTFEIIGVALDIVELGELKIKLKLAGVVLGDIKSAIGGEKSEKPGDNGAMKALAQIAIVGASITFKDKSLVERMIRADAKKKNISEAEAKKKMLDELAEQKAKAEDDAMREVIDLATKFLTKPGEIELLANPAAPANIMAAFMAMMGSPATVKQMLGLTLAVR